MATPNRRQTDITDLMMKEYKVDMADDNMDEFIVEFKGPAETLYQGGVWKVKVELTNQYPIDSPVIRFMNKIYHPNIEENTGLVCLNLFNKEWTPLFDLVKVFEILLPQLLTYPNADDPFNEDAATLMISDGVAYDARVREYVEKHATPDAGDAEEDKSTDKEASESNSGDDASGSGPVEP